VSELKQLQAILIFFGPSPASCKAALELEALVFKACATMGPWQEDVKLNPV